MRRRCGRFGTADTSCAAFAPGTGPRGPCIAVLQRLEGSGAGTNSWARGFQRRVTQARRTVLRGAASGYEGSGPIGLVALARQGWDEFLAFPTAILACFVALAAVTLWMDNTALEGLRWMREEVLGRFVFVKEEGTASVLGQLLGGLLTVISITFSALLLAVQQTATSLSSEVYSQFLRRRVNQLYFGFFSGLAVYDVIALAAAHPDFNPVYTASIAVVMTTLGLCLLLLLIYSTVDQMRPAVIIESLRDHTLLARERSLDLLQRTRRKSESPAPVQATVFADNDGFLQEIRLDRLGHVLDGLRDGGAEIELLHPIGAFLAYDDRLALIRARDREAACRVGEEVKRALVLRSERDLRLDAAYGVVELQSVAWTTASSAKSTPEPPRLVINALRDLLGRWIAGVGEVAAPARDEPVAVVYPDCLQRDVIDALVTIGVASNESLQHVVLVAALDALGQLLARAGGEMRAAVLDAIRTLVPALTDVAFTGRLHDALVALRGTLEEHGANDVAAEIEAALRRLQSERGRLRPAAG